MILGGSTVVHCPFCGQSKELMSILSGNTFGAKVWSDNKQIFPMLPRLSPVQKCPSCGEYYCLSMVEQGENENGHSTDLGHLTYEETKEAFAKLINPELCNQETELDMRILLHHAYNDHHWRYEVRTPSDEDKALFHENALWLIENWVEDDLLKAEFYREIGEFDKAAELIITITPNSDFLQGIVDNVKERLERKDTAVFKIR